VTWRLVAAAWSQDCVAKLFGSCDSAHLAGWDGTSVVIASLLLDASRGEWHLDPRFKVRPGLGRCMTDDGNCLFEGPLHYDDVRALQIGAGGRTLMVLLGGGFLDGWDLAMGSFLGRWRLSSEHSGMCHNGEDLLFVRQGPEGPVLEVAPLPHALVERTRGGQRRPGFLEV